MTKYLSFEDFVENQESHFKPLFKSLRQIIMSSHPKIQEVMKFNTPMYQVKRVFCYVGVIKKTQGVEFCFLRGYQLSNEQGILNAKKRKYIHGITFKDLADLNQKESLFLEIIQEALILEEMNEKSIFSEILQAGRKRKLKS